MAKDKGTARWIAMGKNPNHCEICDEKLRWVNPEDVDDDDDLRWCEEAWQWVCEECCLACKNELWTNKSSDNCESVPWND